MPSKQMYITLQLYVNIRFVYNAQHIPSDEEAGHRISSCRLPQPLPSLVRVHLLLRKNMKARRDEFTFTSVDYGTIFDSFIVLTVHDAVHFLFSFCLLVI